MSEQTTLEETEPSNNAPMTMAEKTYLTTIVKARIQDLQKEITQLENEKTHWADVLQALERKL
jgi:hypothetical protein